MNKLRFTVSSMLFDKSKIFGNIKSSVGNRMLSDENPRIGLEKSLNRVTLLGRVGINPQLRGSESKPVVVFTLATNTNYKYESGEIQQKTDWHRISIFKPGLRDTALEHLKKGTRIYVDGKILYGEFTDSNGLVHNTTTIVANDIIFLAHSQRNLAVEEEDET